ncbi:COG4315 family predicted lipoprotein [Cellulomonas sp. ICMP 17802]|uniref:COG4315 family predicted lipoprotein n=1 Tax=Cellulomonas sp. ICMP 17802 TaxID=3239199 RepID=UPI00351AE5D6
MRRTILFSITALVAAAGLTACGGGGSGNDTSGGYGSSSPTSESSTPAESPAAAASTDLSTAETSLGTVVVDGKGMTAYFFLKDTKGSGTSACSGDCAAAWPAITTDNATPTVTGVTGEVGTITGTDGKMQITIDGRPIYTFANDKAPGDVNGQGLNSVWYVIAPDGTEIDSD